MTATDYNPNHLQSVLVAMRGEFGAKVFEEPPRMFSILMDLAPGLKRDGNVLRQMSKAGLLRELRMASESGADYDRTRLTAKSRLWLTDYLMLSDEKADYFMTALQAAYGLAVEPPKPLPPQGVTPSEASQGVTPSETPKGVTPSETPPQSSAPTPKRVTRPKPTPAPKSQRKPAPQGVTPYKPAQAQRVALSKIAPPTQMLKLSQIAPPTQMVKLSQIVPPPQPQRVKLSQIVPPPQGVTPYKAAQAQYKPAQAQRVTPSKSAPRKAGIVDSGRTGECTWTLDDNDVFTVSGQGRMGAYPIGVPSPWRDYRERIKAVIIERGVTSVGEAAFEACKALTSVTIPDSVVSIKDNAFSGCAALTKILIPNGVTSIEAWAFSGCSGLTSVMIPHSVTSIESWAFAGCAGLQSVNIPDGLTEIKSLAFAGCANLKIVTIPDSVTSIKHWAFDGCDSLNQVSVSKKAAVYPNAFPAHTQITRR